MQNITLALAEQIAEGAYKKAKQLGVAITVSIVDAAGRLVLCKRGDGTGFFTPETSKAKAIAAAGFKRSTKELVELQTHNPAFWNAVPSLLEGVLPTTGAVPIFFNENLIGAIGCGGGSPDQDHECAMAGAQAFSGASLRS